MQKRIAKLNLVNHLVDWLDDHGFFRTCLNCDHWQHETEICGKYNQRPPAKIIVVGCSEHSDEIPF